MDTLQKSAVIKGAEWIVKEPDASSIFIPEDYNEEQQMVKDMCRDFLDAEVMPIADKIDKLPEGLMPSLLAKAGAQGLLNVSIPEELGGLGKEFITSTLVSEGL